MNIINKLTMRNLKKNKRRTLVTIIGVIISVAMLTAVSTLTVSFLNLLQKQEIANSGEWHVLYKNVNEYQIDAIQNDDATKNVVLSKERGYAKLEGSDNDYRPYLFIKAYNEQGFDLFPIELTDGRIPIMSDEVVISKDIAANANVSYDIGDELSLDVGIREGETDSEPMDQHIPLQMNEDGQRTETLKNTETQTYTVVGVIDRPSWEPGSAPGYTVISGMDAATAGQTGQINASVTFEKMDNSLYDRAEQLGEDNDINPADIQYNNELLRYYGVTDDNGLQATFYSLAAIIIAIIVIGSVSLIYNAFAISVAERSRHLGMLSSVGATRKQKRNSVFFEGGVIGLIGIPIGVISGLLGIGITFHFINSLIQNAFHIEQSLTVVVTPGSIITACLVSIVTIFISTYIPARRASKVSAIDAIRQAGDVKLSRRNVKTSKLTRRLFGIEAEIGLKNLKRNRRRYRATIFSLAISIILFLSVSFFTSNLQKSFDLTQEDLDYDMSMFKSNGFSEQFTNGVQALDMVSEYTLDNDLTTYSQVDKDKTGNELQEGDYALEDGKYEYVIRLHALDEDSLKAYAKESGADFERLTDPDDRLGIVIDTIDYRDPDTGKFKEEEVIHAETGGTFELKSENDDDLGDVHIEALTDKVPTGIETSSGTGVLHIIISQGTLDQILENDSIGDVNSDIYLSSDDPLETQEQIEEMKISNLYIHNVQKNRQETAQLTMLMSVFAYGFIALITAISTANIFNTISTSISLRKREFAMLKSVGMTPKSFNKMINYESLFYGIKSLLYGLPISIGIMYLIHLSLMNKFDYAFSLPWLNILYVVIGVIVIVGSAMLYSAAKVKKENIIEALKQENI